MIIIGHELVDYEPFYEIKNSDEIFKFDNLLFKFNKFLILNSKKAGKNFSVISGNLNEILIANGAGAKFIIVPLKLAPTAQKLADTYLFDAKIAVFINNEKSLKDLAIHNIDAAIFKSAILNKTGFAFNDITSKIRLKFQLPSKKDVSKNGDLFAKLDEKSKNSKTEIFNQNFTQKG